MTLATEQPKRMQVMVSFDYHNVIEREVMLEKLRTCAVSHLSNPSVALVFDSATSGDYQTVEEAAIGIAGDYKYGRNGKSGRKIGAIKELRNWAMSQPSEDDEEPYLGLKEAKNLIDEAWTVV